VFDAAVEGERVGKRVAVLGGQGAAQRSVQPSEP
jgi:hypothetical protein